MKLAKCIKDGYIENSERVFCWKGQDYEFKLTEQNYDGFIYSVKTEEVLENHSRTHTMTRSFFLKYFTPYSDMLLTDEDFKIC